MQASPTYNSPLSRRIGMYVILVSAVITLFTSGAQLYSEYKRDVNGVYLRLEQLETTQLSNIASRVWVLDTVELERTLNALLELQSIEYIAVYDYDNLLMSVGNDFDKNAVVVKHNLIYEHNNKFQNIGSIVVKASLDEVYSLILDRALVIVLSNAFKTFIVAGFILFIIYQLVSRHLLKIAKHAQNPEFLSSNVSLQLDRKPYNKESDELDTVVDSINTLRDELLNQFSELKNQQQYLSLTLESIGDAVVTTDIQGRVIRMNEVAESLTGWTTGEAKGQSLNKVFQVIDQETQEPIGNFSEKIQSAGRIASLEDTVLFSRNGNEYHISYLATPIKDANQNILGLVLTFHDVTREFLLRENIAKNKRDMQAIMNHTPAVIYIKDIQGNYIFVNRRYESLFDVSLESILGKNDFSIFDKHIASKLKSNDDNVKRAGHALELEEIVPVQGGEERIFMSVKFPLFDETGNIYAICGISTDITERKLQERHFRRAQKMDALGKLTSGVSHDYNNILGIIVGYAQLLEASLENNPNHQKYAQEIHRAGDRGTKLTKKLLDFSSQDISDAITVNINKLIEEEQHMLEKTLTPLINLKLYLDKDLWDVRIDSGEFEDALVNMIINAMHAIDGSGEIVIKTGNRILSDKEAEFHQIAAGEYVVLSILDTGSGMDEETKERLFDPFYSTKGAKGTGLGLSQVYGFIERSSGAIEVISSPGEGAQFNIYFPRSHMQVDEQGLAKIGHSEYVQTVSGTVLVVDDEPSLVSLLNEGLSTKGYTVLTANNGEDALNILEQQSVDLIISDIIMPNVDGVELATQVQKRYPHIKIQMVSGYTDNRINNSIDKSLAQNILYKPFSLDELTHRVRALLEIRPEDKKLSGCSVMIMDDLDDMRELFKINLEKIGCKVLLVENGDQAISTYKEYMEAGNPVDIVILDMVIPGGLGGEETAEQLRILDPNAKILLASGFLESSSEDIVKKFQLNGTVEKNFNSNKLQKILESVLVA